MNEQLPLNNDATANNDDLTAETAISPEVKDDNVSKSDDMIKDTQSNDGDDEAQPDPFAFTKNGFTSEIYKIEIRGLPKYYGLGEFRKLLNVKLKLDSNKIKAPKLRSSWIYACFRSEKERDNAIKVLSGYKWKGSNLSVKVADPAPDPLMKRRLEEINDESKPKRQKIASSDELHEAILKSTAPLWNLPYEEQIKKKTEEAKDTLRTLGINLVKQNPSLEKWIENQKKINDGLPCRLIETKYLQNDRDNYRNKCELTIGKDELTGERRVGMRLGSYASGSVGVGPIDKLPTLPDVMKESAMAFEKFVQNSKYDVFSPEDLSGHWKQLTIRYGIGTGELMIVVVVHTQRLTPEEISSLKDEIKHYFQTDEFLKTNITSLYFQPIKRREKGIKDNATCELLLGNKYIEEKLCGLKFKISPESFFQINTKCAEVLMDSVKELAQVNTETVLLDVCCGTGTIGLCLAKDCEKTLGIEIVQQAVEAAKENARNNNINNSEFFCGKADEIFSSVMSRIPSDQQAVAILDPPRAGLHNKAILMLRKANNLNRLVYMSCDSKAAMKNFIELGRAQSKTLSGCPFLPVSAVVVDMFPHTNHYELILYFERVDVSKCEPPKD